MCARLREAGQDGAAGCVEELARIVSRIRLSWPDTQVIVRGDSGFCRDERMSWCETHEVDYVLGLAKNNRLKAAIESVKYEEVYLHAYESISQAKDQLKHYF